MPPARPPSALWVKGYCDLSSGRQGYPEVGGCDYVGQETSPVSYPRGVGCFVGKLRLGIVAILFRLCRGTGL